MWIINRFACGKSTASNSTPASINGDTNATLRSSLSSLAIISFALCTRHATRASASFGRSLRLLLATSARTAVKPGAPLDGLDADRVRRLMQGKAGRRVAADHFEPQQRSHWIDDLVNGPT